MDKEYKKLNDEFRLLIENEEKITDEISDKIAQLSVCLEEKDGVMKEMENNSC